MAQQKHSLRFRWIGRLLIPLIFDGEHYFQLEEIDGKTKLTHGEKFSGLLIPYFKWSGIAMETKSSFESMNEALKERSESSITFDEL